MKMMANAEPIAGLVSPHAVPMVRDAENRRSPVRYIVPVRGNGALSPTTRGMFDFNQTSEFNLRNHSSRRVR
jgi:hypothetical protein